MIELPLAHAGHWYHALLYLAPVLIVVVVLWVQERRERRRDPDAEVDRGDLDLEPTRLGPLAPRACGCRGRGLESTSWSTGKLMRWRPRLSMSRT